jgi:hypothetical protein
MPGLLTSVQQAKLFIIVYGILAFFFISVLLISSVSAVTITTTLNNSGNYGGYPLWNHRFNTLNGLNPPYGNTTMNLTRYYGVAIGGRYNCSAEHFQGNADIRQSGVLLSKGTYTWDMSKPKVTEGNLFTFDYQFTQFLKSSQPGAHIEIRPNVSVCQGYGEYILVNKTPYAMGNPPSVGANDFYWAQSEDMYYNTLYIPGTFSVTWDKGEGNASLRFHTIEDDFSDVAGVNISLAGNIYNVTNEDGVAYFYNLPKNNSYTYSWSKHGYYNGSANTGILYNATQYDYLIEMEWENCPFAQFTVNGDYYPVMGETPFDVIFQFDGWGNITNYEWQIFEPEGGWHGFDGDNFTIVSETYTKIGSYDIYLNVTNGLCNNDVWHYGYVTVLPNYTVLPNGTLGLPWNLSANFTAAATCPVFPPQWNSDTMRGRIHNVSSLGDGLIEIVDGASTGFNNIIILILSIITYPLIFINAVMSNTMALLITHISMIMVWLFPIITVMVLMFAALGWKWMLVLETVLLMDIFMQVYNSILRV